MTNINVNAVVNGFTSPALVRFLSFVWRIESDYRLDCVLLFLLGVFDAVVVVFWPCDDPDLNETPVNAMAVRLWKFSTSLFILLCNSLLDVVKLNTCGVTRGWDEGKKSQYLRSMTCRKEVTLCSCVPTGKGFPTSICMPYLSLLGGILLLLMMPFVPRGVGELLPEIRCATPGDKR